MMLNMLNLMPSPKYTANNNSLHKDIQRYQVKSRQIVQLVYNLILCKKLVLF